MIREKDEAARDPHRLQADLRDHVTEKKIVRSRWQRYRESRERRNSQGSSQAALRDLITEKILKNPGGSAARIRGKDLILHTVFMCGTMFKNFK